MDLHDLQVQGQGLVNCVALGHKARKALFPGVLSRRKTNLAEGEKSPGRRGRGDRPIHGLRHGRPSHHEAPPQGDPPAPVALKVARKTARLNRARVVVSAKPVEEVPGTFDLIVANIVSNVLKRLAPVIVKKMRPAGLVILSGILTEEAASVVDACAKAGLKSLKRYDSGEWCSL